MRLTQESAEIGISDLGLGQEGHVAATGQWVAAWICRIQSVQTRRDPWDVKGQGDLGTRKGLKAFGPGRLGELHGAVQPVVIGESQGRIT